MSTNILIQILLVLQPIVGSAIFSSIGGGYTSKNSWYKNLKKPKINPPSIVFPIVWPILYILLGVSSLLVFRTKIPKDKKIYFIIFEIQLLLNWLWSIFFFKMNNLILSLVTVFIMIGLTIYLIILSFKYNKVATYLLIPYILWISFACYLTFYITLKNKK